MEKTIGNHMILLPSHALADQSGNHSTRLTDDGNSRIASPESLHFTRYFSGQSARESMRNGEAQTRNLSAKLAPLHYEHAPDYPAAN